MTVPATIPSVEYEYSGPGRYDFSFLTYEEEHIFATYTAIDGTIIELAQGSDFTVTLDAGGNGGFIVTTSPTATTGELKIKRILPIVQETDYVNNNPLDVDIVETDFDKTIMILQQMDEKLNSGDFEAENWAAIAKTWAVNPEDVPVPYSLAPPEFSSYHWAQKASEIVGGNVQTIIGLPPISVDNSNPQIPIISLGVGGKVWRAMGVDTLAINGQGYLAQTSITSLTLQLPAAPTEGMWVGVADWDGMAGVNPITIGRNGNNIMGRADDLIIDGDNEGCQLAYTDVAQGWRIVATAR